MLLELKDFFFWVGGNSERIAGRELPLSARYHIETIDVNRLVIEQLLELKLKSRERALIIEYVKQRVKIGIATEEVGFERNVLILVDKDKW